MTVKEFRRYLKIPKNSFGSNEILPFEINERKEWTLIIGILEDDNKLSSPQTTEDPSNYSK